MLNLTDSLLNPERDRKHLERAKERLQNLHIASQNYVLCQFGKYLNERLDLNSIDYSRTAASVSKVVELAFEEFSKSIDSETGTPFRWIEGYKAFEENLPLMLHQVLGL